MSCRPREEEWTNKRAKLAQQCLNTFASIHVRVSVQDDIARISTQPAFGGESCSHANTCLPCLFSFKLVPKMPGLNQNAENVEDLDFSDIEAKYTVEYDDSFDNTLVVDGIPVIDKSKLEKLLVKICKEFSRKGVLVKPEDIFMPWDESTGKSAG
ncbi:hypothetical protein D9757_002830 [Collybiopsis confluens]|uniref:Uncharacterized protein n=1 Tax=Collybiopsis confluens TaxID=2823264 RepID=A0A8H5HVX1_9AGAR|nr:hypothetical protein D9757_002830 [Collybiopsis confluens]